MATITLSYNPRNTLAKKTLVFILSLGVFKEVVQKDTSDKVKKGKPYEYKIDDNPCEQVIS